MTTAAPMRHHYNHQQHNESRFITMEESGMTTKERKSTQQEKMQHQSFHSSSSTLGSCSSISSFMSELLHESSSRLDLASPDALAVEIVDDNFMLREKNPTRNRTSRGLVPMQRSRSSRQASRWSSQFEPKTLGVANSRKALTKSTSDTMFLQVPKRKVTSRITGKTLSMAGVGGGSLPSTNAKWNIPKGAGGGSVQSANAKWNLHKDIPLTSARTVKPKQNMFLDKFNVMSLEDPSASRPVKQMQQQESQLRSLRDRTSLVSPGDNLVAEKVKPLDESASSLGSSDLPVMPRRRNSFSESAPF